MTATVNKAGTRAQVALLATDSIITGTDIGTDIRDIAICARAESDAAAIVIKVTGQSSAAIANLVTCNQLCVNGYGGCADPASRVRHAEHRAASEAASAVVASIGGLGRP